MSRAAGAPRISSWVLVSAISSQLLQPLSKVAALRPATMVMRVAAVRGEGGILAKGAIRPIEGRVVAMTAVAAVGMPTAVVATVMVQVMVMIHHHLVVDAGAPGIHPTNYRMPWV